MTSKEEILAEVKAVKDVEGIVAIIHSALMKSRIGLEVELGKLNQGEKK